MSASRARPSLRSSLTRCFNKIFLLAVLPVLSLGPCGCGNPPADGETRVAAPALNLPLADGRGQMSLERYRGKVVLLSFWRLYCGACEDAQPFADRLAHAKDKKAGFALLSVNIGDDPEEVRDYIAGRKISYAVGLDAAHDAVTVFRVRGTPTFLLIDKKGMIRARWLGYDISLDSDIENAIKKLMAEPA